VTVVGWTSNHHYEILVGESGRVYGDYDSWIIYLGPSLLEAIDDNLGARQYGVKLGQRP